MIGCILLAVLAALILLSFFLRLGVLVGRGQEGFLFQLRIGPGHITLSPKKKDSETLRKKKERQLEKAKKKKRKAEKKAKKPPKQKRKLNKRGLLSMGRDMLPVGTRAGKRLLGRLQIDRLELDMTWAAGDPADAAIRYGQTWAAVEALLAFLENHVVIKERQVTVRLDFYREKPLFYGQAGFSLTLAQLTAVGLTAGVQALRVFLKHRKELFLPTDPADAHESDTKKGELNHGKEPSHQ